MKDLEKIKNDPSKYTDDIYYKELIHDGSSVVGQLMIVTYSPSYALYQKSIRSAQLERAEKMVDSKSARRQKKNPNDPKICWNLL